MEKLGVLVVGAGLIGARRAEQAMAHPRSRLVAVVDKNGATAATVAGKWGAAHGDDWGPWVARADVQVVVVATPNAFLKEVAVAAMRAGKHVLIEKPMGRNLAEAEAMAQVAQETGTKLKIGFNHRYHPALLRAHELYRQGVIGEIINIRARYGHGGRPGYEKEWRGSKEMAGGGELTDQGVHVLDLIHWFAGQAQDVFGFLQTAVWPLHPLEDSGFALLRFPSGAIAQFHTTWTQWKNLFSFEVFGQKGSLVVEGLGRSYGQETLTISKRRPQGGAPYQEKISYDEEDISWAGEWDDFIKAIDHGSPYFGTPADGVAVMRMLDGLYRAAETKQVVTLA